MKILTLITVLGLLAMNVYGQFKVSGKISDSDNQVALTGANIRLKNAGKATFSRKDGSFLLTGISKGDYTLVISYLGYEKVSRLITVNGDLELDILMIPAAIMTDEVIVTATRATDKSSMTYSVLKKEEIEKQNFGMDLPFLLNQLPSVVITSDAGAGVGYTGIRIRGSDATRINVTINGIPLNDPESQGVYWVDLPDLVSSVQDIQVQRGVGTSTNGPGAFGASINIPTSSFSDQPYATLSNAFGSFNTRKHTLLAGTGLLNNKFAFDARLSRIHSDGYIDRAASDLNSYFTSAAYYGRSTLVKLNIFSGSEKTYQAWWGVPTSRLNDDFEGMQEYIINNGLTLEEAENLLNSGRTYNYYTYDDETDNYRQDHYQLLFAQDITPSLTFNTAFYHVHGEGYFEQYRQDDDYAGYGFADVIIGGDTIRETDLIRRRWLDNDLFGTNVSFDYNPSANLQLIFGGAWSGYSGKHFGEVIWMRIAGDTDIRELYYDNVGEKYDFNAFVKASYSVNDRLHLFGDLQYRTVAYQVEGIDNDQRQLNVDENLKFFNPKMGITYDVAQEQSIYTSLSVGNREPDRNDFIDAPAGRIPEHETLYDLEAGYRKRGTDFSLEANFYYMYYKNQLVLTGELNDVGSGIRINVPESYRAGIELAAAAKLGQKFSINLTGTLSRNKIRNFEEVLYDFGVNWDEYNIVRNSYSDTDISFSPSVIAGGTLNYYLVRGFEIALISKYVSKQYLDNTGNNARVINSFFVNDLRMIYKIYPEFMKEISFSLLVNNIFNNMWESNGYTYGYIGGGQEFRENLYYPQAGTHFLASLVLKF